MRMDIRSGGNYNAEVEHRNTFFRILVNLSLWITFSLLIFLTVLFYESPAYAFRIFLILILPAPVPVYGHFLIYGYFFHRGKYITYGAATAALIVLSGLIVENFFNLIFPEPDSHISGIFMAFFLVGFSTALKFVFEGLAGRKTGRQESKPMTSDKLTDRRDINSTEFLFYRDERATKKVRIEEIILCKSSGNFVDIVTVEKTIRISGPLKKLEIQLSEEEFMRVHRSFIVCLEKIDYMEEGFLRVSGKLVPIGRSYQKHFDQWLNSRKI